MATDTIVAELVPIRASNEVLMEGMTRRSTLALLRDTPLVLGRNSVTGIALHTMAQRVAVLSWHNDQVYLEQDGSKRPLAHDDTFCLHEQQYAYRVRVQVLFSIRDQSGDETFLKTKLSTRMGQAFNLYAEREGVDRSFLVFVHSDQIIKDSDTPATLGLREGDVIRELSRTPLVKDAEFAEIEEKVSGDVNVSFEGDAVGEGGGHALTREQLDDLLKRCDELPTIEEINAMADRVLEQIDRARKAIAKSHAAYQEGKRVLDEDKLPVSEEDQQHMNRYLAGEQDRPYDVSLEDALPPGLKMFTAADFDGPDGHAVSSQQLRDAMNEFQPREEPDDMAREEQEQHTEHALNREEKLPASKEEEQHTERAEIKIDSFDLHLGCSSQKRWKSSSRSTFSNKAKEQAKIDRCSSRKHRKSSSRPTFHFSK